MTSTKTVSPQTSGESKFKQDLQTYFPDLYKFWSLFSFDKHYEQVLSGILEMVNGSESGTIKIIYQQGRINQISLDKVLTADKKARHHYD